MKTSTKQYRDSWSSFKAKCILKTKDRCKLTYKNWIKLKKWHLDRFLQKNTDNPFGFLFRMKTSGNSLFLDRTIRSKYFALLKRRIKRRKELETQKKLIISKK